MTVDATMETTMDSGMQRQLQVQTGKGNKGVAPTGSNYDVIEILDDDDEDADWKRVRPAGMMRKRMTQSDCVLKRLKKVGTI